MAAPKYSGPKRRKEDTVSLTSVEGISKLIKEIGVVSAIAAFLVYVAAMQVPKLIDQVSAMNAKLEYSQRLMEEHVKVQHEVKRELQKICIILARDKNREDECFKN